MNLKQAQAILSDLLMKCEEENLDLPPDPLEAIIEAIQALRGNLKHEMRRSQMDMALDHMKAAYGVRAGSAQSRQPTTSKSPPEKRRRASSASSTDLSESKPQDEQRTTRASSAATAATDALSAPVTSMHSPAKKKARLQDDIRSQPAVRVENQSLVDQLVKLGEYELRTHRSQRGVTRLRAARQIRDSNDVITSGKQARQLEGVGASAAAKVDVLLCDGLRGALKEYADEDKAKHLSKGGDDEGEGDGEEAVAQAAEAMETKTLQSSKDKDDGDEEMEDEEDDNSGEECGDSGEEYRDESDRDDDDDDDDDDETEDSPVATKRSAKATTKAKTMKK